MTRTAHDAAKAHFLNRIGQTPLQCDPAPHAHIRQAFPASYFKRLLDTVQLIDTYSPTVDAQKYAQECLELTGHSGKRDHVWVKPTPASVDDDAFLNNLASWITAPDVLDVLDKAYLAPAPNISGRPPSDASIRLVRECGVSYIRPHLDKQFKIMTMVFFLAEGVDPLCPGTELYVDEPPRDGALPPRVQAPFEGNSVFILPRTPHSWHGVRPVILDHPRNTMHIYLKQRHAA